MTCNKSCKQCDRIGRLSFQRVCISRAELGLTSLSVLDDLHVCGYFCTIFCKDKSCRTSTIETKEMQKGSTNKNEEMQQ
jgi:hypothetical protein